MKDALGWNTERKGKFFECIVGTGTMTAELSFGLKKTQNKNLTEISWSFIIQIIFLPTTNMNILSLWKVDSTRRAAANLSSYRYSHEACFLLSKPLKTQARNLVLAFPKMQTSLLVNSNRNITSGQHRDTAEILRHKILIWQNLEN